MSLKLAAGAVVSIESATVTPQLTERRLSKEGHAAVEALSKALVKAKVIPRTYWVTAHKEASPIAQLLDRVSHIQGAYWRYWRKRTLKAESVMRATLSKAISGDERHALVTTLYGRAGARRNAHLLSDAERAMIDHYRGMDERGRQMIRTLFARLAATKGRA